MKTFMTIEWDEDCGIEALKMIDFLEDMQRPLQVKDYGLSLQEIGVIVICRAHDFKQRKIYKKARALLDYDVILDFYLIKNLSMPDKIDLIKYQISAATEALIDKYKFQDFDKNAFLDDFNAAVRQAML